MISLKDYEAFHSKPFELLINKVDIFVDTTLGTSSTVHTDKKGRVLCNYLYSIRHKYRLIFNIARHLNNDFKIIKEYIMQESTKMHDEITKVVDITDFQKMLPKSLNPKVFSANSRMIISQHLRRAWLCMK